MKITVCFYITSVINYFAATLMLRTPTYMYVCHVSLYRKCKTVSACRGKYARYLPGNRESACADYRSFSLIMKVIRDNAWIVTMLKWHATIVCTLYFSWHWLTKVKIMNTIIILITFIFAVKAITKLTYRNTNGWTDLKIFYRRVSWSPVHFEKSFLKFIHFEKIYLPHRIFLSMCRATTDCHRILRRESINRAIDFDICDDLHYDCINYTLV